VTVATGKNPWSGTTMAGLEISGVVNRKDFGMEWNKTLDAGGLLLGDEVKLDIQLETSVPAEKES
jgi:polyisoprenoid-binding protein YceI